MKKTTSPKSAAPSPGLSAAVIASAIAGALFAVLTVGNVLNAGKLPLLSPDFIKYFHPMYYGIAFLVLAGVLLLYGTVSRRFVYIFTYIASLAYALVTALIGKDRLLMFAMCGLCVLMTVLCGRALSGAPSEKKKRETVISPMACKITLGVVTVIVSGGVLFFAISSYTAHTISASTANSTYIQLLHSLRSSFSMDVTVEFGEAISHMAAHVSPIFFLYLPFYALLPSPITLMVIQTIAVFSSVIPLWLLARRRGLSAGLSGLLCGLLCLFPAVWCAASYSLLHEYALLLPLLLWLIWAWEAGRKLLIWVFFILVLAVQETAALHLLTLALYWLIVNRRGAETDGQSRKTERRRAGIMALLSLTYLVVSLVLLAHLGRGTPIARFDNVTGVYGTFYDSFFRELFSNPALVLYEMLTVEKLFYVLTLLLPLGLLPLLSRHRAGLVFLFPLLFLNLLSDFSLHHDADFPYGFAVSAFGFYLAVQALETLKAREDGGRLIRRMLAIALSSTAIITVCRVSDLKLYTDYAIEERAEIEAMDALLERVEPDASVSASGRLRPALAERQELYRLSHEVMSDYVVLDLRESWAVPSEKQYDKTYYIDKGYRVIAETPGVGVVLGK